MLLIWRLVREIVLKPQSTGILSWLPDNIKVKLKNRMKNLLRIRLIIILGIISIKLSAQEKPFEVIKPELAGFSANILETMDKHFHGLVEAKKLAGIQTAIISKGKLVHFNSYGYANLEEEKLIDSHSIFRIFSMTKPIVSVALMQLYEEGKIDLEAPLYKYLPIFKNTNIYRNSKITPAKNPIKIIDLLRHTSGFTYGRNKELNLLYAKSNLFTSQTNKEFVEKLSKLPLEFEPGTDWKYGFSTTLCGYLVEVISGKSLDVYLKENIFNPLKMNDTHFELPKEKAARFTVGYGWNKQSGLEIVEKQRDNRYLNKVTFLDGSASLVSTTYDYLKFCQMILNKGKLNKHRILKIETVELMLKDQLTEVRNYNKQLQLPKGETGFGLGFSIKENPHNKLEKEYGWGGIAGTFFKMDLDRELAYVLMIQLRPNKQLNLVELFQKYIHSSFIE